MLSNSRKEQKLKPDLLIIRVEVNNSANCSVGEDAQIIIKTHPKFSVILNCQVKFTSLVVGKLSPLWVAAEKFVTGGGVMVMISVLSPS